MKLNPNCIKDILTTLESTIDDAGVTYTYQSWDDLQEEELLQKYPLNEIAYHCQQIYLSGYLYCGKLHPQGGMSFTDITPDAHALLANLRIPKIYAILQKFVEISGSASINQMATVAAEASVSFLPEIIGTVKNAFQKTPQ